MEFVDEARVFLAMQVDLDAGLDLAFTSGGLEFTLNTPGSSDIDITVLTNLLNTNEASLIFAFQQLFPLFAPELEDAIESFPVPALLGLELQPVELVRTSGGFIGLFADLVPIPTTTLQNVTFSDTITVDFRQSGGCWLREWRHPLSGNTLGGGIRANLKGMLGADAGCTTNDAESLATASYRVSFDVVSVPGEQWTLDLDHSILGALDRVSDGYNDGILFLDGGGHARFNGDVHGSWSIVGGGSGSFDFTPVPSSISDGIGGSSSSEDVEFSGANGTTLIGTGDASLDLDFSIDLDTFSNSNTAFPTANGDEMAIRLGKNDTIDANFSSGEYPGVGSRNIAEDGHEVTVQLSVAPAP